MLSWCLGGRSILGEVTGPLQLGGAEVTLGHGGRKACFQGSQQDSKRALSLEGGGGVRPQTPSGFKASGWASQSSGKTGHNRH